MSRRVRLAFLTMVCAAAVVPCRAVLAFQIVNGLDQNRATSGFHPDSSYNAEAFLRNAARHVQEKQWPEAIDLYQRVIEQHGDAMAVAPRVDADAAPAGVSTLYVNARDYCQSALSALPAEGLRIYRQRVDAQAQQLFEEASAKSDLELARKLVETYFGSSWGDDGLSLLGDLAFQQGRFSEALAAYRALVPDADGPAVPAFPEPEVDRVRVLAKKLLCRAALGEAVPDAEVAALRDPDRPADERFAGQTGPLHESVRAALAGQHWTRQTTLDTRWPTFAGAADRNGKAVDRIDVGSFQWKVDFKTLIDGGGLASADEPRGNAFPGRAPAAEDSDPGVFPIVVGEQVVFALEDRVVAFHLNRRPDDSRGADTVRDLLAWQQVLPGAQSTRANEMGNAGPNFARSPRTTLTATGDRIIARLGPVGRGTAGGYLYAIRNNREIEGKLLWRKPASEIPLSVKRNNAGEHAVAAYEGAPVADESRVYVALTEAATETWVHVACLDAETGAVLWTRYLGNASSAFDNMRQTQFGGTLGSRLLTLANRQVYYQTNMGAVACLDAETGAIRWLATYPTRDALPGSETRRGPNPAVAAGGLIIVAPDDADSLFAFDAMSGSLAWRSLPLPKIVHVLGAAQGKVFATGDRLYTIDQATGRVLKVWPDAGLGFDSAGRGLLANDSVYWPTKTEIVVLDQESGGLKSSSIPLYQAFGYGGGNLAVGEGYLVVAQRERVVVFCQNRRLIDRYRSQIAANPDQAWNYFQLGRLSESTGDPSEAIAAFRDAASRARTDELLDGRPLADEARSRLHRLLLARADRAIAAADWLPARDSLDEAVLVARTDREKLSTGLRRAELEEKRGDFRACVATLQELLAADSLMRLPVPVDPQRKLRADLWIAERLKTLIAQQGREIYASQDLAAQRLLQQGNANNDARLLEEVGRSYPVAKVAPQVLVALAELNERQQRWAEASSAYKRLLFVAGTDTERARALLGLAHASESRGDLADARAQYQRALERYGPVDLNVLGVKGTVASIAAARLAGTGSRSLAIDSHLSGLPLERKWVRRLETGMTPLMVDGRPAAGGLCSVFLSSPKRLTAVLAQSGATAWTADLEHEPTWVGRTDVLLLVGSAVDITALRVQDGQRAWRYDPREAAPARKRIDPFARPEPDPMPAEATEQEPGGRFHDFHLTGSRLLFLRGDRAIVSLDTHEGRVDWAFEPPAIPSPRNEPRINPNWLVTPDALVLQLGGSHAVLVLDADSGARRAEFARDQDETSWLRPPVALDDQRVVLVLDPRTVVLFDLVRGVDVWSYQDDSALPRAVAPRVLVDQGQVFVLFGGQQLARLDAATGHRAWFANMAVDDLSESPRSFAFDAQRIYAAVPGQLLAIQAEDGSIAWKRPLTAPEKGWAVDIRGACLAVYLDRWDGAAGPDQILPLLLLQRESGRPVQRLALTPSPGSIAVRLDLPEPLVATRAELWALQPMAANP